MRVQEYQITFFVLAGLVRDPAFEHEIKLAANMLMFDERVCRGIRGDSIKHQLALPLARQPRHRQTVAEVAPLKMIQCRVIDFPTKKIIQRAAEYICIPVFHPA